MPLKVYNANAILCPSAFPLVSLGGRGVAELFPIEQNSILTECHANMLKSCDYFPASPMDCWIPTCNRGDLHKSSLISTAALLMRTAYLEPGLITLTHPATQDILMQLPGIFKYLDWSYQTDCSVNQPCWYHWRASMMKECCFTHVMWGFKQQKDLLFTLLFFGNLLN